MTTTVTATGTPAAAAPPTHDLPPISVAGRLEALRAEFDGIDALVVTTLANVRYLTGFTGSAGVLLVTPEAALLTTDGRYRTQSAEQVEAAGAAPAVDIAIGGLAEQRKQAAQFLNAAPQVGLEADNVSWAAQRTWAELLDHATLVPTSNAVEALREIKDAAEIARMERAAAIADAALRQVLPLFGDHVTEEHFALELDTAMRRLGAEGVAFETIVAAGPNSAKPHHRPGPRHIEKGDPVVVDFGAMFEGYRSDMTRTFCVDAEPKGDMAKVFAIVKESQAAGAKAVRPGIAAKEVDDVCRDIIAAAGWADRFEHGTGHGVGLDIHEAPTVSQLGTAILAPGFVVTVEPGVYLPGQGGVRVEDTLVVTEDGARALTNFTKDIHGSLN
jgi:Xaa-Pro aminopeptidase